MNPNTISYTDGVAYEQSIGKWSRIAGAVFLDWLAPREGMAWCDVGCGNGAFTQLLLDRANPGAVTGIDPSDAQLAYARNRLSSPLVELEKGSALALPYAADSFDVAVMALVIFFVPDPPKAVAEMRRVVRPGGLVAAYAWDMMNDGFPFQAMQQEMEKFGIAPTYPPQAPVSEIGALKSLWSSAGLLAVEGKRYTVVRAYSDFEDLWTASSTTASVAPKLATLPSAAVRELRENLRKRVQPRSGAIIEATAAVTAVRGLVPHG